MTAKDGKGDPQDTAPRTPRLFPAVEADRAKLQASAVATMQRIRTLEAQRAAITREKNEELKKLEGRLSGILEEIADLG